MHAEDPNSDKLNGLWAAYRDACPDPEASPEFMPKLWRRIEARRSESTWLFKRFAQACVAATAATLILLSTVLTPAAPDDETFYSSTYADVLAEDHTEEAYRQALPADLPGEAR